MRKFMIFDFEDEEIELDGKNLWVTFRALCTVLSENCGYCISDLKTKIDEIKVEDENYNQVNLNKEELKDLEEILVRKLDCLFDNGRLDFSNADYIKED